MKMMKLELNSSSCSSDQENKIGIMGYEDDRDHDVDDGDSFSSDVSSVVSSDDESDDAFDVNDSPAGSPSPADEHPLGDMSGLLQQLPSKRGLSKHFQGKSQSFTSLANVTCLEDLAKPENPYNKKLKACRSYAALSRVLAPPPRSASSSKLFAKNPSSRSSCSSLNSRPPTHPSLKNGANASGFSNQTPLIV